MGSAAQGDVAWNRLLKEFKEEAGDDFEGEDDWEQELLVKLAIKMGLKRRELQNSMEKMKSAKDAFMACWNAKLSQQEAGATLEKARKATRGNLFELAKQLYEQYFREDTSKPPCILVEYITICRVLNVDSLETMLVSAASTGDNECLRRLIAYLMQEGRSNEEIIPWLQRGGWCIRLCPSLFNYGGEAEARGEAPLRMFDDAVPPEALSYLQNLLDKDFFDQHHYNAVKGSSDTCGFFSYHHDLTETQALDRLFAYVRKSLIPFFPLVAKAQFCEWWTHMRVHNNYHQLHFDTDNEGINGLRNPVLTVALFLCSDAGGPTLVTSQAKDEVHKTYHSAHGWLAYPKVNRLVAFPNLLHGVLPGKGRVDPNLRRHTLMISFWENVDRRPWDGPGSTRAVADCPFAWTRKARETAGEMERNVLDAEKIWTPKEVAPLFAPRIWENIDGSLLLENQEVGADQCFQF